MTSNPLIVRRVRMLEGFLDSYAEHERVDLSDVKVTLSNRYVPNQYDANYRFAIGEGFEFRSRIYWVKEASGPVPYLQAELALAKIPSSKKCEFYEYLLDLNHDFHDPLKLGVLEKGYAALFIRGRIDKVSPDYFESLIQDLGPLGTELFGRLQTRFGRELKVATTKREYPKPSQSKLKLAHGSGTTMAALTTKD